MRKYNQIIGFAREDIAPGQHVHVHNVELHDFARDYAFGADVRPTAFVPEDERASFDGFLRTNGKAGTRNFIGVLSTVNCSATVATRRRPFAWRARRLPECRRHRRAIHGTGCGMADRGEGFESCSAFCGVTRAIPTSPACC